MRDAACGSLRVSVGPTCKKCGMLPAVWHAAVGLLGGNDNTGQAQDERVQQLLLGD